MEGAGAGVVLARQTYSRENAMIRTILEFLAAFGVALAMCLLLLTAPVWAAYDPPELLMQVLCERETRNLNNRDAYVGPHGEIGRCAIRITTVQSLGFDYHPMILFDAAINRVWAREIVRQCARRHGKSVYRIAYCYNAGPRARVSRRHESHAYALEVLAMYRARRTQEAKR